MPSWVQVANIQEAVNRRLFPTITVWNRLEGRPRTVAFDRSLQAEVRDPLWMLTRQWQMGEFRGSDNGSPVFSKLQLGTTRLTEYRPDAGGTELFEYEVPLEAKVERRPVSFSLDMRLLMGRRWLALSAEVGDYRQAFLDAYPIQVPDPNAKADAPRIAHPEVWQLFDAVAGRAMDGASLYAYLTADPTHHASDGITLAAPGDGPQLDERGTRFVTWFQRQFYQPPHGGDDAWVPERLEYQFAASAPLPGGSQKVYVADEYAQGRLDWYSVDVDATAPTLGPLPTSDVTGLPPDAPRTMIPTPVSFSGMPNTRWWSFEDHRTNFGDIDASTTDLARLLFLEFALVYANDWFVIPYTLPAGAIATIQGFVVTNVFGDRLWIDAADRAAQADWQRWSMFTIDVLGQTNAPADVSLLLLPTVPKLQEGPLTEEVLLIRDEVANMVWGIETTVPLAGGQSMSGTQAARETLAFFRSRLGPPPAPPPGADDATIRYQVMTTVPENWIPFLPVHIDGNNRQIQLQRAALPRILEGDPDPPVKVQPLTVLLREGLDRSPPRTYFVHEEEVPRAGARLTQYFQRTRWHAGRVFTWLRVRKQTGRGEGSSGLAFDRIVDVPPPRAS
jgi:hypothetical protein